MNKNSNVLMRFFSSKRNIVIGISLVALVAIAGFSTYLFFHGNADSKKAPVENNAVINQYRSKLPGLKSAAEKDPTDASAQIAYAQSLYVTGDKGKAKSFYEKAIALNGEDGETLNKLGNTYRDLKDYAAAERAYKDAYAVEPGLLNAYVNLATMQAYTLNRPADAVKTYEQAVSKLGQTPEVLNLLANAYEQNKQNDRAISTYKSVLTKDPKNQAAQQNIERLTAR